MQVAVVGLGRWGRHLARNFNDLGKLCAVVDLDQDRCLSFGARYDAVPLSFEDACTSTQIDAIVLAVPVSDHVSMAVQALNHDKHVWVEKPLCVSSEEALMLQALAHKKHKHIFIDYLPIYHPAVAHLKSQNVALESLRSLSTSRSAWGVWREEGVIWDLLCHDVAVLKYLWPQAKLQVVSAMGQQLNPRHAFEDHATVHLLMDQVPVQMQVSCMSLKKVQRLEIVGESEGWLLDYQADHVLQHAIVDDTPMEMSLTPVDLPVKEPLLCAVQSFIDGLEGNEMKTPISFAVDVEDVIRDIHHKIQGLNV